MNGPRRTASAVGYGLGLVLSIAGCAAKTVEPPLQLTAAESEQAEAFAHSALARDQAQACSGRALHTRKELEAMRECRVVVGDLVVEPTDFAELTAADLPVLDKITGSLLVFGSSGLRQLELPALHEVGTPGSEAVLELAFDRGTLERIALPALRAVHGDFVIGVLPALASLQLPSLTSVDGSFSLLNLPALVELEVAPSVTSQRAGVAQLCRLTADQLPELDPVDLEASRILCVGCSTEHTLGCEEMSCRCE